MKMIESRVLDAIAKNPGIGRKALSQHLSSQFRHQLGEALSSLKRRGLIRSGTKPTAGRSAECWHATTNPTAPPNYTPMTHVVVCQAR